jgi:hypothetical protein
MVQPGGRRTSAERLAWMMIPLLALIAVHPLIAHGCSCGHDFDFHVESWLDAATQFRQGVLRPQWTFSAAWNAGEPRFVFYPPLSWVLGALLTLLLPFNAAPIVFTWLALSGAGLAMFALARRFASPGVALLAATIYLANPYLLFTAFERTAYAELLAAAWLPLLVLAALRRRPTVAAIAIPLTLLWLTNAPAAVIGSYSFAWLAGLSLLIDRPRDRSAAAARVLRSLAGAAIGLCLAGFYLVPAVYEQRWVQIAMAIIPNMRVEDSFLFGHTQDVGHNVVLHTASVVGVVVLGAAALALLIAWLRERAAAPHAEVELGDSPPPRSLLSIVLLTTILLAFLLTPPSLFLWRLLPKLAFVQFPWRTLSLGGVVLGAAAALALRRVRLPMRWWAASAIVVAAALSGAAYRVFHQPCDPDELPAAIARHLAEHHGMMPTDEYTPGQADDDVLRPDDPGYWLASDAQAAAPGTVANPAEANPNFDAADMDEDITVSANAPPHLSLHLEQPEFLILNLRDYPAWDITVHHPGSTILQHPGHEQRDDGLVAIALPAGDSAIDVRWHHGGDEFAGWALSACGLAALGLARWRSRRIRV